MEIKLGNKVYILPNADELTADENWKILQIGRKINKLEEKATAIYNREKTKDPFGAPQDYVITNVTMMEVRAKLNEILAEIARLELEEKLKKAKIEEPKYDEDKQYNSLIDNYAEAYTNVMDKIDEKAQEYNKKAQEGLESINSQSDREKVDKIIEEFEANRQNRDSMDKTKHDIAEELEENLNTMSKTYNETAIAQDKGIFSKIKNFFSRKKSTEKLEKQIRKDKKEKLDTIVDDTKDAFSAKNRKQENKETVVKKYKERLKGAVAASLVFLGIGSEFNENEKLGTDSDKTNAGLKSQAITEVSNINVTDKNGDILKFENTTVDLEKIAIVIEKNKALAEEVKKLRKNFSKEISQEQTTIVVNNFDKINSKNISKEKKKREINNYVGTSDNLLTTEEKQETVKEIENSIAKENTNNEPQKNQFEIKANIQEQKNKRGMEFTWNTIQSIMQEKTEVANEEKIDENKEQAIVEEKNTQKEQKQEETKQEPNVETQEKREELLKRAKELREQNELITNIFSNSIMSDSTIEQILKINLKGVINEDYLHEVMKNDSLSKAEKEKMLKDKILKDYKESMESEEVKKEYEIINSILSDTSIPNSGIAKDALKNNLEYADEKAIDNAMSAKGITDELRKDLIKRNVQHNYKVSQLDDDEKKLYKMVESIMSERNLSEGQKQATIIENLGKYIPEKTINEIFNSHYNVTANNENTNSEAIRASIENDLKNEVMKLQNKKGYEDIYAVVEEVVRNVPKEHTESALKEKLSSVGDMKKAIDVGEIDVKDLANKINQSEELSYVTVENIAGELVQVRKDNTLTKQEQDLKDILNEHIENTTIDKLEDEIEKVYPIEDMKTIGFLQEKDIEDIFNNKNFSKKDKIRAIMRKITAANEEYDKLGFNNKQKDTNKEEYER